MTANVVLLVTLRHTARHKCSIGLRSGLTAGYSILFQILEVLFDDLRSVGASVVHLENGIRAHVLEVWDCHWLQNVITIPHCGEVSFDY